MKAVVLAILTIFLRFLAHLQQYQTKRGSLTSSVTGGLWQSCRPQTTTTTTTTTTATTT